LLSGIPPGKFKKSTAKNYEILLAIFNREFGDRELESITSDEVMGFLIRIGEGTRQATKKFRYALLKAFFNVIRNTTDENIPNPCDTRILRKIFREPKIHRWDILEKDLVDEWMR
jgi:integrase/recombinase XerD